MLPLRNALISVTILAVILTACTGQPPQSDEEGFSERKIQVTATIGMITDIAQNVGGERVEVIGLMGPGVDPHLYKASEKDVSLLDEADVIFFNGLHLEAGMSAVLERMEDQRLVVKVSDGVDPEQLMAPEEFEGAYDPHIWFDVSLWMKAVETVRDTLIEMDPEHEEIYQTNAAAYLEELEELDSYVLEQAGKIPAEKRVLITAHDAFNYFGAAYGFEVKGLQGISTESEASTADVKDLATFIVEREIPAIFVESSVPQRNVEAVQAAVQAQGFEVSIGGELFSDAMGDPGTEEGTYIGMVRHNIDTITSALSK